MLTAAVREPGVVSELPVKQLGVWVCGLVCVAGLACSEGARPGGGAPEAKPASAEARGAILSLSCGGGTFSKFRLKNTKVRSYEQKDFAGAPSGQRCTLDDKAEGVIWIATGEGHELSGPATVLSFKDDRQSSFEQVCWTKSSTMFGVAKTEIILRGPPDSQKVSVTCGGNRADVVIE